MRPAIDVERLLEKLYGDIKHIEAERHWFLAAFAVAVAGSVAFLGQTFEKGTSLTVLSVLWVVSFLGLLHSFRAGSRLDLVQTHTRRVIDRWAEKLQSVGITWKEEWHWAKNAKITRRSSWWRNLLTLKPKDRGGGIQRLPNFTTLYIWAYLSSLIAFSLFLVLFAFELFKPYA